MLTFTIRLAAFRRQGKVPNPIVGVRFRYMCLTGKWDTMDMSKFFGFAAASALAAGLSASAAFAVPVVVNDGDTVNFGATPVEFIGDVESVGGSGSFKVTFVAATDGAGVASVTIGKIVAGTFEDLMLSWSDGESKSVVPESTSVSTIFTDPATLSQLLTISWGNSLDGAGFDVEGTVSAIPLPAAGLLLLGGLGALGFAGRRKVNA